MGQEPAPPAPIWRRRPFELQQLACGSASKLNPSTETRLVSPASWRIGSVIRCSDIKPQSADDCPNVLIHESLNLATVSSSQVESGAGDCRQQGSILSHRGLLFFNSKNFLNRFPSFERKKPQHAHCVSLVHCRWRRGGYLRSLHFCNVASGCHKRRHISGLYGVMAHNISQS
ncbi:hypothetical protein VTG60DRAFT_1065 [Thermothelomyces hinnuleus]